MRDVAAFNMRYRTGTMPEPLLQAAEMRDTDLNHLLDGGVARRRERRPRLTIDEKIILLREAIRVNGSVDIKQYPPMILNFTFPGNQERFQKKDGSQWDEWPVGQILFGLRKGAKGEGTHIVSEEQITRLEALTDEAGNHLRIRPESNNRMGPLATPVSRMGTHA